MKNTLLFVLIFLAIVPAAQSGLPSPDKVLVVILENHGFDQIIGSSSAPYINSLVADPHTALFTNFFAIEHPSQPNYLDLFSGSNQGVSGDEIPSGLPFSSANLASALIGAGHTFVTYSEDLPETGSLVTYSGAYARRHNPVSYWQGAGTNQVPPESNKKFSDFPKELSLLPTVCFVVPNTNNDMHNGADPQRIAIGDAWVRDNLGAYVQWAKSNNALFVLTFDEDDNCCSNRIFTLFVGAQVLGGSYNTKYNFFNLLRTIEEIYGASYSGAATDALPITDCWSGTDANDNTIGNTISLQPNPASEFVEVSGKIFQESVQIRIFNALGELVSIHEAHSDGSGAIRLGIQDLPTGYYILKAAGSAIGFIKE